MASSNKKVIITGAGGFIGSKVVEYFHKEGFQIYAIIHKNLPLRLLHLENITFIYSDISKCDKFYNSVKDINPDIIIHAAAIAKDIGSDKLFRENNFEPIKTIAKLNFKKLIYISSTDVYGIKDFFEADERTRLERHPINPYQKYKIQTEQWIESNIPSNKYVIIRPAAVWGENDMTLESRVVEFLKQSDYIIHFGKWKGQNRWPMANVESLAKAIYEVSQNDEYNGEAINIIDNKYTTIDRYYREIAAKHFPNKQFKTLYLPLWIGKIIGFVSTKLSNLLGLKKAIFEPTEYSLKHISSNLDFRGCRFQRLLVCNNEYL